MISNFAFSEPFSKKKRICKDYPRKRRGATEAMGALNPVVHNAPGNEPQWASGQRARPSSCYVY
jgi:hypothetical protein